jgi:hypothetical protein
MSDKVRHGFLFGWSSAGAGERERSYFGAESETRSDQLPSIARRRSILFNFFPQASQTLQFG